MGGFIALTMAARHGSMVRNVVIVGSQASGPEMPNPPTLDVLNPNITAAVPMSYVFPQAELDPGKHAGRGTDCCQIDCHLVNMQF